MVAFRKSLLLVLPLFILAFGSCGLILPFYQQGKQTSGRVPLFPAAPYTPGDLGLEPESPPTTSATLPVITDLERVAIKAALEDMEARKMMTTQYWQEASRSARVLLFQKPYTSAELDAEIDARFDGGAFPHGKSPISTESVLAEQTAAADAFYNKMAADLPTLTDEQLISLRVRLTVSLVVIRLQLDYGDKENGLPEEIVIMYREKMVGAREKVTDELLRRGVARL